MANETLTFKAWQRSKLFDRARLQSGRLQSTVALSLTDTNTGRTATGDAPFVLMAAVDVAGLKPSAIKHMAPAPFTRDAETTKLVHIDLWEKDLPWRYTPQKNDPNALRPWLVLLVGTGEEIQIKDGIIKKIDDRVLFVHNLDNSHLWAHTQHDGHSEIARILSPRGSERDADGKPVGLLAQHEYLAVLVPAFNQDGQPMWRVNGGTVERNFGSKEVLPAFHFWRFWTAEAGDFETLAAALRIPPAADVGKAKLHYRRSIPADDINLDLKMEVRGAITSLQPENPPNQDELRKVLEDVDSLNDEIVGAIGLPRYGRPWVPEPDKVAAGWPNSLTDDPRFRGIAGLGVWMGVEAQEALTEAAVQQAGALREAGQRINQLAFGLLAAGRLWDRRLPSDKNERLRILGPIMTRLIAKNGGIVLDQVTSGSSPLSPALFSSAAQRILRDRSTPTRHLVSATGGIDRNAALHSANQPEPQPERAPHGLPHLDTIAEEMGLPPIEKLFKLDDQWIAEVIAQLREIVIRFNQYYQQVREDLLRDGQAQNIPVVRQELAKKLMLELSEQLQARLSEREMPCEGAQIIEQIGETPQAEVWEYYAHLLESDSAQGRFYDALWQAIRRCMARRPCEELIGPIDLQIQNRETFCDDLLGTLAPLPLTEQKPIDLGKLSDALYAALDPRQPNAPARLRLCNRLTGVDCSRLIPPEFAIGLDFPTWDLLRKYDKEWLLPGVGKLSKDSITALQTNPAFIDAFMVGINSQFISEMRWRDLAVDRTCTPLRMFWGQINYATQKRQADIQPLIEWAKAPEKPIGDLTHQSIQPSDNDNKSGSRLVIAFRTDLFRRYPATLVYLVKPKPGSDLDTLLKKTPELEHTADGRADREFFGPIFAGTITPEITFFAFDVMPSDLEQYWLVLDEPPAELRFRNDEKDKPQDPTNSATFAKSTLDQPTRVAISGHELENLGIQP
jgi:hypothetical protein